MSLEDAFAPIYAQYRADIQRATWGHLAPTKNKTYSGYIVWALDLYDSGYLNPKVLACEMRDLPDSPWFYSAMIEFLQSLTEQNDNRKQEEETAGKVYRWDGTFKNYKWKGTWRQLHVEGMDLVKPVPVKLTKKDFQRIAAEIRQMPPKERHIKINALLPELRASNPRFNDKAFVLACGLGI